jgi:cytochrome P450
VADFHRFAAEPLAFLAHARRIHGNLFVIRENGPVFSREADCAGVVAAFGTANQRTVLADIESFGMPSSAAQHLKLSPNLINLNRGLHSMRADQHAVQKRVLMGLLNNIELDAQHQQMWTTLESYTEGWLSGNTFGLLGQLRELMIQISAAVLFGTEDDRSLALLLQIYFQLRRDASSHAAHIDKASLTELVAVGRSLDTLLRAYIRKCRKMPDSRCGGLLARLANLELETGRLFSEDEVVGHSNVFFISSTEPVSVALTWVLLILSQLPNLRDQLRLEQSEVLGTTACPAGNRLDRLSLLDRVINESLRLLPPNALMVRLTTQPISLGGIQLPRHCEIVLCPFLSHRDSEHFQRPDEFLPDRWRGTPPSPFQFFPFGAGGHSCAGRTLAMRMIKIVLAFLLARYDLVLSGDQHVDWRVNIMFTPLSDPEFTIRPLAVPIERPPGKLDGPVGKLLFMR